MRRSVATWLRRAHTRAASAAAALGTHADVQAGLAGIDALRSSLERADLFWVTEPMAHVAMDAAQDVPALHAQDCPAWDGLMVCAAPLPPIDVATGTGTVRRMATVDAIAWARRADTIRVTLLARPEHTTSPAHARAQDEGVTINPFLNPVSTIELPMPLDLTGRAPQDTDVPPGQWPAVVAVAAFLSAAWVLMNTPTVTTPRALNPATSGNTTRPATSSRRQAPVTLIDLRPGRQAPAKQTETGKVSTRHLTSRHVVRGHWTHQPHGPGRQLRRLQWIDDYVRGPADTPLTPRETVYIWRR